MANFNKIIHAVYVFKDAKFALINFNVLNAIKILLLIRTKFVHVKMENI